MLHSAACVEAFLRRTHEHISYGGKHDTRLQAYVRRMYEWGR